MNRPTLLGLTLTGILCASSFAARADSKVKPEDVPAPVKSAVAEKYAGAEQKGWETETEGGKTVYEVKLVRGKEHLEVSVTPEGKIASEETELDYAKVPEAVKTAFRASAYGKWKVHKAERILEGGDEGKVSYELAVEEPGKGKGKGKGRAEVVFDPAGKILKEEKGGY